MKFIILSQKPDLFFQQAIEIEKLYPTGNWEYTNLSSTDNFKGLYSFSEEPTENLDCFSPHNEFLTYFLGTFSPKMSDSIDIHQTDNFKLFCLKLNELLRLDTEVLDISVQKMWIWTKGSDHKVSDKLQKYLSFN